MRRLNHPAMIVAGLALGLAGVSALAQDEPTGPVTASGTPANPSLSGQTSFQNASANSVLDLYEELSGKHLIRDINLGGVNGISINANGLSKDAMMKMIQSALLLNGVAIIPVDDQTDKVITVATNKNPRSEGIKVYANAADLPNDDEVVSYYMPLTYINPQEAAAIFNQDRAAAQLRLVCSRDDGAGDHHFRECRRDPAASSRSRTSSTCRPRMCRPEWVAAQPRRCRDGGRHDEQAARHRAERRAARAARAGRPGRGASECRQQRADGQ